MYSLTRLPRTAALVAVALLAGCSASSLEGVSSGRGDSAQTGLDGSPRAVQFIEGYSEGFEQARATGKPMLVLFMAQWCSFSRQMLVETFTDDQVVRLADQFVCIRVDADNSADVCREFEVRGFPTVQFLSPRGVPLNRLTGKTPGDALALQMQAALQATASRTELERKQAIR